MALSLRQATLGREPAGVIIQRCLGIDPVAGEDPAAEMMDKQFMDHGQFEPGAAPPLGQVIIVEETNRARTAR